MPGPNLNQPLLDGQANYVAEDWARAAGFTEMGSDAEIENADSLAAHRALGYAEIERVVCFRRAL